MLLLPGDRFIIRQFSPVITIGGGRVLDAAEQPRRMKPADRLAFLQSHGTRQPAGGVAGADCAARAERMSVADAVAETGWLPAQVEKLAGELSKGGRVVRLGDLLLDAVTEQKLSTVRAPRSTSFTMRIRWLQASAKSSCESAWACGRKFSRVCSTCGSREETCCQRRADSRRGSRCRDARRRS